MKEEVVMSSKLCELCHEQAILFCPSDSAFLCFQCDAKVHEANFLVARHIRLTLCSHSNSRSFSSLSTSSTCISSATQSSTTSQKNLSSSDRKLPENSSNDSSIEVNSAKPCQSRSLKLRDPKVNSVFEHWCTKLGFKYGEECAVVRMACDALGVCSGRFRALPLRVCLAASLWFGVTRSKSTRPHLIRLEEISGVPAKLILTLELKLQQIMKANNKRRQRMEESWAESSP